MTQKPAFPGGRPCRMLAWNCRRAGANSPLWDYLAELQPHLALLQEVGELPATIESAYRMRRAHPRKKNGGLQNFQTVILAKGDICESLPMLAPRDWVSRELEYFSGNLLACRVDLECGLSLNTVSVHSPAWPLQRSRLAGVDVSGVKLEQNPDVWVADLLWFWLQNLPPQPVQPWVVAGDFNASETFDAWAGGPRGNREFLDRMASTGLVECLRHDRGRLTPTFRNPRGGKVIHQMDHLFVSPALGACLAACDTGDQGRVFSNGISDHLPILADFLV